MKLFSLANKYMSMALVILRACAYGERPVLLLVMLSVASELDARRPE